MISKQSKTNIKMSMDPLTPGVNGFVNTKS